MLCRPLVGMLCRPLAGRHCRLWPACPSVFSFGQPLRLGLSCRPLYGRQVHTVFSRPLLADFWLWFLAGPRAGSLPSSRPAPCRLLGRHPAGLSLRWPSCLRASLNTFFGPAGPSGPAVSAGQPWLPAPALGRLPALREVPAPSSLVDLPCREDAGPRAGILCRPLAGRYCRPMADMLRSIQLYGQPSWAGFSCRPFCGRQVHIRCLVGPCWPTFGYGFLAGPRTGSLPASRPASCRPLGQLLTGPPLGGLLARWALLNTSVLLASGRSSIVSDVLLPWKGTLACRPRGPAWSSAPRAGM